MNKIEEFQISSKKYRKFEISLMSIITLIMKSQVEGIVESQIKGLVKLI